MKIKKIIFLQRSQYGYLTDTYKIAERLAEDMEVLVVCFDVGLKKYQSSGVNVSYVERSGNYFVRALRLIKMFIFTARENKNSIVFVVYFPLCSLVSIFGNRNSILDFRTGSGHRNIIRRFLSDFLASTESLFFKRVTLISEGLRKHLHISFKKSQLIPLGSDEISKKPKVFDYPRLFYIGSLNNRNIDQTLWGIKNFLQRNPNYEKHLTYDIVGDGPNDEIGSLERLAFQLGIEKNINLHGRMSHDEAQEFFDNCNIGISYVPITEYYNYQPPTKTFEYIRSGIPVIATSTVENSKIITNKNGVLCNDNSGSFSTAIEECVNRFSLYNDSDIRNSIADKSWNSIVQLLKSYLREYGENQ